MLLKHFDSNSKYIGSKKTTAVLNDKAVSLLLHTESGGQPLINDHVVNGWMLKPKEDLTVYMVYNLTLFFNTVTLALHAFMSSCVWITCVIII